MLRGDWVAVMWAWIAAVERGVEVRIVEEPRAEASESHFFCIVETVLVASNWAEAAFFFRSTPEFCLVLLLLLKLVLVLVLLVGVLLLLLLLFIVY